MDWNRKTLMQDPTKIIKSLSIWQGQYSFEPLSGGLTNHNYLLSDEKGQYVVRLGDDIPEHHVMRFNELAASRAAHAAGISPAVIHSQPGVLVLEYIPSKTFAAEDVREQKNLERTLAIVKSCHQNIPQYLHGPVLIFWVFHVLRDYDRTLRSSASSHLMLLPQLAEKAALLEKLSGPFEIVFSHNDLVPANFLDDGNRLWMIDWDYAGFNSPLFDLGGIAANCLLSPEQEIWML
jgi:thiamine kinase-like enzyme